MVVVRKYRQFSSAELAHFVHSNSPRAKIANNLLTFGILFMLKERINNDLKEAMKAKDELTLSVLRMFMTAIKNKEIMLRKGEDVKLTDEQIAEIAASEIKKRKDSIVEYEKGKRVDLANKEKKEIVVLKKYLPEQLSDKEIEKEVKEIIAALGEVKPSDFGKVMGSAMARLKGKADGGKVGEIVKKVLEK